MAVNINSIGTKISSISKDKKIIRVSKIRPSFTELYEFFKYTSFCHNPKVSQAIHKKVMKNMINTLFTNNDTDYIVQAFNLYFDNIANYILEEYPEDKIMEFLHKYENAIIYIQSTGKAKQNKKDNKNAAQIKTVEFIDAIFDLYVIYCEMQPDLMILAPNPNNKNLIISLLTNSIFNLCKKKIA